MANIDRTKYDTNFRNSYQSASYYDKARSWDDYSPAYNYAYQAKTGNYAGRKFEDAEGDLERGWDKAKSNSSLMWNQARDAVRDGWHFIERAMPGDADRDGR